MAQRTASRWIEPGRHAADLDPGAPTLISPKTKLPGEGHASPIVWGVIGFSRSLPIQKRTTALLLCLDRKDGNLLWKTTVLSAPPEAIHRLNSYASSTPATDGERVFSTFLAKDQVVVAATISPVNLSGSSARVVSAAFTAFAVHPLFTAKKSS